MLFELCDDLSFMDDAAEINGKRLHATGNFGADGGLILGGERARHGDGALHGNLADLRRLDDARFDCAGGILCRHRVAALTCGVEQTDGGQRQHRRECEDFLVYLD